jgi:hypothetical protein
MAQQFTDEDHSPIARVGRAMTRLETLEAEVNRAEGRLRKLIEREREVERRLSIQEAKLGIS